MTADWTEGYVADVAYTHGFYHDLTPAQIRFALLLKGVRPPEGPFRYCELGFGQGFGLNLLAAANPEGEFWGTDFNPTHAAGARLLAEASGATNLKVFDHSFAEFLTAETPEFDFISLHGVWSWISDENRRLIAEFLRRRLRLGGAVYISYNAMPGWAAIMPLRELMTGHAALTSDPVLTRIGKSVEYIGRLQALKLGYLNANPVASARFDRLRAKNINYLAHEYFNRDLQPKYFFEMVRELAAAKLTFASSANLADHITTVNLRPEAQAVLDEITEPVYRETVRDFLLNQQFRRDIFVRGAPRLAPADHMRLLLSVRFSLLTPREHIKFTRAFPAGNLDLRRDIYEPLLDALAERPATVGELLARPAVAGLGHGSVIQALTLLAATGDVAPAVGGDPEVDGAERSRRTEAFNAVVLDRVLVDDEMQWLASPVTSGGVLLNLLERLFVLAMKRGQEPVGFAYSVIRSRGQFLVREDGTRLNEEGAMRNEIARNWQVWNGHRLPIYRQLGVA